MRILNKKGFMAKIDMTKRKSILDRVVSDSKNLCKRIIVIDGFEKMGKTTVIENIRLFLETLGYDVKIKKESFAKDPNFFKKEKDDIKNSIFLSRVNDISISLMELANNENLFIIYDRLYFSTILHQFDLDILEYVSHISKLKMEYKEFNSLPIEHIILLPKNRIMINEEINRVKSSKIHAFDSEFLSPESVELIENRKNKIIEEKKNNNLRENFNIVEIEKCMSKKGVFIKVLKILLDKYSFSENMIDVEIKYRLSSLYNFDSHGKILSICRGLDKPLEKENILSTIRRKHYSTLQFFHYTFFIKDIPRTVLIELSRYRTINAMCVESTRYVLNKLKNPEEKIYKFFNPTVRKLSIDILDRIIKLVNKKEVNNDEIKMSLPESFTTSLYMKMDLRNLSHLLNERTDRGVHREFRRLSYSMLSEIHLKNPEYFEILALMI